MTKTIEPLLGLFAKCAPSGALAPRGGTAIPLEKSVAYLIDRWPDKNAPFLETELAALRRNRVPHLAFVLEAPNELSTKAPEFVMDFEYLPDSMVIEAEWQANQLLVRELETMRASQKHRPSSDIFLQQARAGLMLCRMFRAHRIGHVHATSSRTLLCAVMLRQLLGLTISVAVEEKPVLSQPVILEALDQCVGGRSAERELLAQRGRGFLFDPTLDKPSVNDIGPWLSRKAKIEWTGGRSFWEEWSELLTQWTRRA